MDKPNEHWSRRFVETIRSYCLAKHRMLRQALDTALEEYLLIRKLVAITTKQIRALSQQKASFKDAEVNTEYTWYWLTKLDDYHHRTTGHETI